MSIDPKQLAEWKALAEVVPEAERQMRLDDVAPSLIKPLSRATLALITEVERLREELATTDGPPPSVLTLPTQPSGASVTFGGVVLTAVPAPPNED